MPNDTVSAGVSGLPSFSRRQSIAAAARLIGAVAVPAALVPDDVRAGGHPDAALFAFMPAIEAARERCRRCTAVQFAAERKVLAAFETLPPPPARPVPGPSSGHMAAGELPAIGDDPVRQRECADYEKALDAYNAEKDRIRETLGEREADDQLDAAFGALDDLLHEVAQIPARTIDGIAFKARLIDACEPDDPCVAAVIRDVLALAV